jgi:hypothetical protein
MATAASLPSIAKDFKRVASTISPHRRYAVHCKLFVRPAKMNSQLLTYIGAAKGRFIVCGKEKLTAFLKLESAISACCE